MELSQLRAFVAVSRAGTLASAAQDLHVTSSPLSRTIRDLERQLGDDLFVRKYHQFERTPFGNRFLPLAVEIIAQSDEAAALASGTRRGFRVGSTPWTFQSLIQALRDHSQAAAGTTATSETSDLSSALLQGLRHGDLDLALVHLPVEFPGIVGLPLARYRYSVMGPRNWTPPALGPVPLADLAGQRLLTFPLMMQPTPMRRMLERMHDAGIESVDEIDLRDVIGLESRIERSGELMLVSPSDDLTTTRFLDLDHANVVPLTDGAIEFAVGLAWRERDTVNRSTIARVVAALTPPDGDVPYR